VCQDFSVNDTICINEDCGVLWGVIHGFPVETNEVEERGYVGGGGRFRLEDHARPERRIVMARCDKGVGGGRCTVGVSRGDESSGCGRGGIDEVEAGEGEVGVLGQVAMAVRGRDIVEFERPLEVLVVVEDNLWSSSRSDAKDHKKDKDIAGKEGRYRHDAQ